MEDDYFVLSCSEDGDVYFQKLSKKVLLSELKYQAKETKSGIDLDEYLIDMEYDTIYKPVDGDFSKVIIKGKIVVPKPKKVVATLDVE